MAPIAGRVRRRPKSEGMAIRRELRKQLEENLGGKMKALWASWRDLAAVREILCSLLLIQRLVRLD